MKNRFSFISLSLGLCLLGISCNKQLDQKPISDILYQDFWKTAADAKYGMASVYSGVQKTFSNTFTEWGDARSDNFGASGTGENQVNISYNGLTAVTAAADWSNLYSAIARANVAIKYVPTITDPAFTTTLRNHYLGQSYAVRAFMYFWAIRLWGDVPLRLEPYESVDAPPNLPRTNKDSIMNNVIIPDLKKAMTLIDKKSLNIFEVTVPSILSILTEVYLWKHDYANVIATTDQLIALRRFSLVTTPSEYKDVFITAITTENIWSLNWNYITDGANGIGAKLGSNSNTSNFQIDIPLDIWEADAKNNPTPDIRRYLNYDTVGVTGSTGTVTAPSVIWKFYPIDINTGKPAAPSRNQNQAKLPFYRWPDILLMRAEALNWANDDKNGAFAIINQIRRRAGAVPLDSTKAKYKNQIQVEEAILDERQLELFAEGKRWFDLVRTDRVLSTMDPIIRDRQFKVKASITGFTDPRKILWPISRVVLNVDPSLTQNPPYSK